MKTFFNKSAHRRKQFDAVDQARISEALAADQLTPKPKSKPRSHHESETQRACVKWYRLQFAHLRLLLFAIPNGGYRSGAEAAIMHGEGVTPGVSDLFLSVPRHGFHGLYIEMKYGANDLSEKQQAFKLEVQKQGYKFATCWRVEEFIREVSFYLGNGIREAGPVRRSRP